jgi:serine/threonine-protein kinase
MTPDSAARVIGQVVANRYEIDGVIGRGGQATVYRAQDRIAGRPVAIKILSDAGARDPQVAGRFAREQEALRALQGTHVVQVLDTHTAPSGALYLVMELLDGRDLEQLLCALEARGERATTEQIAEIMEPVIETLHQAHAKGIFHRDLKPANIYLLRGGGTRLLDFGFARLRASQPLTAAGMVMGSPSYIAPELWRGRTDVDHRADVYSLAVILYRMLAGRLPFWSDSLHQMLELATTAKRPSLKLVRPDLPSDVDLWVQQALAVEPSDRFRTVRALYNGLLAALASGERERRPEAARPAHAASASGGPRAVESKLTDAIKSAAEAVKRWTGRGDASAWKLRAAGDGALHSTSGDRPPEASQPAVEPPRPPAVAKRRQPPPPPVRSARMPAAGAVSASGTPGKGPAVIADSGTSPDVEVARDEGAESPAARSILAATAPPGVTNLLIQSDYRLEQATAQFSASADATPRPTLPKPAPPQRATEPGTKPSSPLPFDYKSDPPPPAAAAPEDVAAADTARLDPNAPAAVDTLRKQPRPSRARRDASAEPARQSVPKQPEKQRGRKRAKARKRRAPD